MVKKIILLCTLISSTLFATEVNWAKNYQTALNDAKNSKKLVLMVVDRRGCPYCELLKEDVIESASVTEYINKNFIPLLVTQNDGTYPEDKFIVHGTPTTYFITAKGEIHMSPIIGYVKKDKYLRYLGMGLTQ
ncbi:MAG: thioredoxin-related protein [Sulfurimonas sp.]|jgi:thioredoxin-related protein